jgi:hypothetical protein
VSNVAEERFRDLYDRRHPAIIAYFARRIGSQDVRRSLYMKSGDAS